MGLHMGCHMAWGLSMCVLSCTGSFVCVCLAKMIDTQRARFTFYNDCSSEQHATNVSTIGNCSAFGGLGGAVYHCTVWARHFLDLLYRFR
jgi:hypothetical protein